VNVLSELQTVSVTIGILTACISVVIGVVNQILSRRRTEKTEQLALETRQAQLFMQVYNRWTQRDTVKSYGVIRFKYQWTDPDDWLTKYHADVDPEAYADHMTLFAFFEGLGVLVKKGLIDISLVEDLFSQRIIWFWEYFFQKNIQHTRKLTNDPTQYDSIEYLYNLMKQRLQQTTVST
jgi:hypothetical protein